MDVNLFSGEVMTALIKSLDTSALRQRVSANNIANVNTPYFKKSSVEFESYLQRALSQDPMPMRATHARHFGNQPGLDAVRPEVIRHRMTLMRTDLNNVDIDEEMTKMAANSIMYQTLTKLISDKYSGMSSVISGGRR
ncbi:MAG: flagellar basal body rod protein FlgB [Peptococcaceae bacterium]|nr:flagellar basal body rod protein FlgB [Peptococcaceae bacterium]